MHKKLVAIDFDGVLHSYTTPWSDATTISDGPTPGAMAFLYDLHADGRFDTVIVSSRCKEEEGRRAILYWLHQNLGRAFGEDMRADIMEPIQIVAHRPPAHVTIDDRGLTFNGMWPDLDHIAAFKPWNKLPKKQRPSLESLAALGERITAEKSRPLEERVEILRAAIEGLPAHWRQWQWEADPKAYFGEKFVSVLGDNGKGRGRQAIATVQACSAPYFGTLAEFIAAANPDTIRMLLDERDRGENIVVPECANCILVTEEHIDMAVAEALEDHPEWGGLGNAETIARTAIAKLMLKPAEELAGEQIPERARRYMQQETADPETVAKILAAGREV
ncbi:hypothetical protein GCM10011335_53180 [Aureimonas glaciei]|uniref:Uncharacterized protein n=2 Tax=Aureimonas glaciei TaxID=1776957 RepID=A0A916YGI9_9HYPH|nr:hypothetical protein GCM10011335_53180 [Aureimonas glaciei]